METNVIYTHELTINTTKIYEKGVLSIGGVINSEFERLDTIKPLNSTTGQKFIEVSGLMHLYGYKVENGGFFDLKNLKYYPEFSRIVQEGTITEVKAKGLKRKQIRNKSTNN